MHIPGYEFPRHRLKRWHEAGGFPLPGPGPSGQTAMHGLFYPMSNVVVFGEDVSAETLGEPVLILVAGRMTERTRSAVLRCCENGTTVIVDAAVAPPGLGASGRRGLGRWLVTEDFLDERSREAVGPLLGSPDCWRQRFGDTEVRMYAANASGTELVRDSGRSPITLSARQASRQTGYLPLCAV